MTRRLPERNVYWNQLAPTPLAPVQLSPEDPVVWCKLDFLNPSGSTKDRIARHILEKAWREGRIGPEATVVEASSGSTSIAMALACAQLGVRFIAVMPEGVSTERALIIRVYGGEIRFTSQAEGIRGSIAETERMAQCDGHVFLPRQFANWENSAAHRYGTAREILDQIPGNFVDIIVSGVGTGGTLVGLFQGFRDVGCPRFPSWRGPSMPVPGSMWNPAASARGFRESWSASRRSSLKLSFRGCSPWKSPPRTPLRQRAGSSTAASRSDRVPG